MATKFATVALGAALVASATACSSGGARNDGDIALMVIADLTAPGFSFPQIVDGAQAAVNEVNRAGGIDGRTIALLTCDSQNDPNAAAACARKAVAEEVSAVVGMQSLQSDAIVRGLEAANIPAVGGNDIGALDRKSPISFPLTSTPSVLFAVAAAMPGYEQCTKPGVFSSDVPITAEYAEIITDFFAENVPTASPVRTVSSTVTATDVTAQVATLLEGGTDCVFMLNPPALNLAAVKAIYNSGAKVKVSGATPALPPQSMADLGEAAIGVYSTSGFKLPGTAAAADVYSEGMNEVNPEAIQDTNSEGAYAGVKIVAQAMTGLEDQSPKAVLNALNSMKNIDVGVVAPIPGFPADSGLAGIPRTFNTFAYSYQWDGQQYVMTRPEPIDVKPQLAESLDNR
ncbi:ABC transporter substrate-binding protein (plasmid) [Rhodococcus sp. USK10]|uniref:ABC transporter substrate-binding protein n=1 Tax=Rhodococcus sp. USK10 TaxID=2789739 RepID=UPI001C5DE704|nr:ABC transporter substrate-binding protein [Rhodococcus sp. USK10]QYB00185.1 ABC transporter substrate-binding protein [Rhodococcus sp. USK10]